MHGLQPLLAFAETAKRGSFAMAAREMGCTPSTLAKAVTRLEDRLGVRLFHRTTRQVTLTDDGKRLFGRCQRILSELEGMEEEASGIRAEPEGTLRIDMPVTFGRVVMMPLLAELLRRHPRLSVEARFSDAYVDLVKEGVEVAIRAGGMGDSSLVAKLIGHQEIILIASPAYLARAGIPLSVADLSKHAAIRFRRPSTGQDRPWHFRSGGRNVQVLPPSQVRVDGGEFVVRAATLGLGIGQIPHYMATEAIASGDLVEVLAAFRPAAMPLYAVMPSSRMVPARVRALLKLIEETPELVPPAPRIRKGRVR